MTEGEETTGIPKTLGAACPREASGQPRVSELENANRGPGLAVQIMVGTCAAVRSRIPIRQWQMRTGLRPE